MVSSTDSSDWNGSPPQRPPPIFVTQEPTNIVLPEPVVTDPAQSTTNRSSSSSTPRLGSFSVSRTPLNSGTTVSQQGPAFASSSASPIRDPTFTSNATVTSFDVHGNVDTAQIYGHDANTSATPKAVRGGAKTVRRGRGGGTSRSKIKAEPQADETTLADVPPVRSVNRGGRPRGSRAGANSNRTINRGGRPRGSRVGASSVASKRPGKRKRRSNKSEDEDDAGNTSGSEAMNLPTLSSSGRRITQANAFTRPVINLDGPSSNTAKKSRMAARIVDAAPVFLTGAMKRKLARNPAEAAVCRNCGRGHSPNSNQIVFCDGCETPWHQFCHDRPISPTVIQIEESEWHCADCEIERSLKGIGQDRVTADDLAQTSGIHRTLKWKQDYLLQQPKETLVALLLKAHEANEQLPLFEPDSKAGFVATAAVIMYDGRPERLPNAKEDEIEMTGKPGPQLMREKGEATHEAQDEDEGYYEEPLPYPKMGNGLTLPPEEDDLGILVDEDKTVYSHVWKGDSAPVPQAIAGRQQNATDRICDHCNRPDDNENSSRFCRHCEDLQLSEFAGRYLADALVSR